MPFAKAKSYHHYSLFTIHYSLFTIHYYLPPNLLGQI